MFCVEPILLCGLTQFGGFFFEHPNSQVQLFTGCCLHQVDLVGLREPVGFGAPPFPCPPLCNPVGVRKTCVC